MTLWPAAGLLLLAAVFNALGILSRARGWKAAWFLASTGAAIGAFWLTVSDWITGG